MENGLFTKFVLYFIQEIKLDLTRLACGACRNPCQALERLTCKVNMLETFVQNYKQSDVKTPTSAVQPALPAPPQERTFTAESLAQYNGRNGNPAYVAVNGLVYDVSSNAAWAAATHFGLQAGNDLTSAFQSCHAGSDILSRLPVVGRLIL